MAGDDDRFVRQRATALLGEGRELQRRGDLARAIELYSRSLHVFPTAEAYTYRGWARAQAQDYEQAIADCHQAIVVDPTLGNPYNDIGAYLVKLGRLDEAIIWFEHAKHAPRYETAHFPYMNLGRVFALRGQLHRAIAELEGALRVRPGDGTCLRVIAALRAALN